MIYEKQKTKNISFPLGGIGTGCIGLSGNGELREWEIFNRPNKKERNGYSHFAIKATCDRKTVVKVLHGDTNDDLSGTPCKSSSYHGFGYGPAGNSMAGFPHFESVSFDGSFPLANLIFSDGDFPGKVRLCAFNPFIPHDEYNSSLPSAFFEWEIENVTDTEVRYALACTVQNPAAKTVNQKVSDGKAQGVWLNCTDINESDVGYSDLCILTDGGDVDVQEYWYRGAWQDGCTTYWKNLSELERMPERSYAEASKKDHGTVVSYVNLQAGQKAKLRFVISWNVPYARNYWGPRKGEEATALWKNYYATQFESSFASAKYSLVHFDSLLGKTAVFSNALQSCTLPDSVKDAIGANLSVIKTPTALRLDDGTFWGWEGCIETVGSCHGTCQHVWNYAYVMPYLFPRLERSIRESMLNYALLDNGATDFRLNLPLKKQDKLTFRACVDGQMGEVIKCYREWKFSGDDEWLRKYSGKIFSMLEYAWSDENPDKWDADMDGVMEGRQHHTLDMELFGPSSWLQGFYLLALDCGAQMAKHLGDTERAERYAKLYDSGKKWTNENLFNGKYFMQKVDLTDRSLVDRFGASNYWNSEANEIKYQVAEGCIIDQMLSDWHAVLIGVNGVFDQDKKKTALENLYRNNYKASMREVTNMWRNFSLNDESGTVICSYPDGVQVPAIPIPYCEETMTGFEYALAGLMIAEGYVAEGESMVKAIRDRYDGEKRNPWNEIECGSNYARSMASFALMPIYSGFTFDMTEKHIGFAPITGSGKYLFSIGESWGTVETDGKNYHLTVLGTPLTLDSISIPDAEAVKTVTVDGRSVDFKIANGKIILDNADIQKTLCIK